MKKIVLTWGLISGAVLAAVMWATLPRAFSGPNGMHADNMMLIGYSSMVLAFLMVFFGIRAYRESVGGGKVTWGKAFQVGILIALIGSAMYVLSWEVMSYTLFPDFAERYAASVIGKMETEGAPAAEIAKTRKEMAEFAEMYRNPLVKIGMTFLEVFPVGLLMTLIAATALRRGEGRMEAVAA